MGKTKGQKRGRKGEIPGKVASEGTFRPWLPGAAVLIFLVFLAYAPALDCGFIWDDPQYVIENDTLRSLEGLGRIWFGIEIVGHDPLVLKCATPQYYPLVFSTLWIEYQRWGLDPFVNHLVNILLHAGSAVLLWVLLRRLSVPAAWLVAAVFALHPVHVESVAWITERKNVLSLLFYLSSALAYLRFALPREGGTDSAGEIGKGEESGDGGVSGERESSSGKGRSFGLYGLALLCFLCALLSKTVTASLPAALILVLWWKKGRLAWKDVLPLVPFLVLGAVMGLITVWMEETHVGAQGEEWSHTMVERCLLAGRIPWFYAWKLVLPVNLIFFYPRWNVDSSIWWQYAFPLATLGVLAALWFFRGRLGRGPLVAVLFFVGSLAPALGFFNVFPMRFSYVADHFQYLASLGLIVLLTAGAALILGRLGRRRRPVGYLLGGAVLAVLGTLTWHQTHIYKDQETLWRDTLDRNPSSWIAHSNLSEILVAKGELVEAMAHCRAALELKPDLPEAHGNLANIHYHRKEYEEAVHHYEAVLQSDPDEIGKVTAMNNMALAFEAQGKTEEAVAILEEALRLKPDYVNAHYNLANQLFNKGRFEEGARHYAEALRLVPGFKDAHYRLGVVLQALGRREEAVPHLRAALQQARLNGDTQVIQDVQRKLGTLD